MADFEIFATDADLEAGWRSLSPNETATATELLKRASAKLATLTEYDASSATELQKRNLATVCCDMVRRAMTERGDAFGLGQQSEGYGAWQAETPVTDLYLTSQERELLGLSGTASCVWL